MPLRSPYDATAERYNSISTVSKQIHIKKMQYIHCRGVWVDRKVEDGGFWGDLKVGEASGGDKKVGTGFQTDKLKIKL